MADLDMQLPKKIRTSNKSESKNIKYTEPVNNKSCQVLRFLWMHPCNKSTFYNMQTSIRIEIFMDVVVVSLTSTFLSLLLTYPSDWITTQRAYKILLCLFLIILLHLLSKTQQLNLQSFHMHMQHAVPHRKYASCDPLPDGQHTW